MPLTLVTGPANAAKAGEVLGAFREALSRASSARLPAPEPLLVVPTAADVEPYQRELAGSGTVFGGEVVTFQRLLALMRRCPVPAGSTRQSPAETASFLPSSPPISTSASPAAMPSTSCAPV